MRNPTRYPHRAARPPVVRWPAQRRSAPQPQVLPLRLGALDPTMRRMRRARSRAPVTPPALARRTATAPHTQRKTLQPQLIRTPMQRSSPTRPRRQSPAPLVRQSRHPAPPGPRPHDSVRQGPTRTRPPPHDPVPKGPMPRSPRARSPAPRGPVPLKPVPPSPIPRCPAQPEPEQPSPISRCPAQLEPEQPSPISRCPVQPVPRSPAPLEPEQPSSIPRGPAHPEPVPRNPPMRGSVPPEPVPMSLEPVKRAPAPVSVPVRRELVLLREVTRWATSRLTLTRRRSSRPVGRRAWTLVPRIRPSRCGW